MMPSPAKGRIPETQVASDLQIEQWVQKEYGFIPHPFWIRHCKELYIQGPGVTRRGSPSLVRMPSRQTPGHQGGVLPLWNASPVSLVRSIAGRRQHAG